MNQANRIPTDTVDQDEASLVGAQMVVFSSGNWLSREAFQELGPTAPAEFFKLPRPRSRSRDRAGLLPPSLARQRPIRGHLRHWLDAHRGTPALLSFRGELLGSLTCCARR
jgi:hypothetical protein